MIPKELATTKIAGLKINFHIVKGEVLDTKTWSETKVESTTQRNTRTNAEWVSGISSTATEITELYLRTPEGNETSARIYDSTAGVRKGNSIALLFANDTVIGLQNKEQGKYWWFNTGWIVNRKGFFVTALGFLIAVPLVPSFFIGMVAIFIKPILGMQILGVVFGVMLASYILGKRILNNRKKQVEGCVRNVFDVISQS